MSRKNIKIVLAGIFLAFFCWNIVTRGFIPSAFASPLDPPANNVIQGFVQIIAIGLAVVHFLIFFALKFITFLINPELVAETLGGNGAVSSLNKVWVISRDITNGILAFTLVAGAIYAMIRPGEGGNLLKANIQKFIVAVIVVNFSWWFPRVILDVANVLTATVIAIPAAINSTCTVTDDRGNRTACQYINDIWLFPTGDWTKEEPPACAPNASEAEKRAAPNIHVPIEGLVCIETTATNPGNSLGTLQGLYINHLRVLDASKVSANLQVATTGGFDSVQAYIRFAIALMLAFLYVWGIGIPLLGMVAVFAARLIIIWLTVAFMPFMFIGFVLGSSDKLQTMRIFQRFVNAAFLPVLVMIPLSIGYLMITVIAPDCNTVSDALKDIGVCKATGTLFAGINTWWNLIWTMMAMAVMWVGFFAAIKGDEIFAKIGGIVQSAGKAWMGFPTYFPVVPSYDNKTGTFKMKGVAELPVVSQLSDQLNRLRFGGGGAAPAAASTARVALDPTVQRDLGNIARGIGTAETLSQRQVDELRRVGGQIRSALQTQGTTAAPEQRRILETYVRNTNRSESLNLQDAQIKRMVDELERTS